jgi:hypothetical protein
VVAELVPAVERLVVLLDYHAGGEPDQGAVVGGTWPIAFLSPADRRLWPAGAGRSSSPRSTIGTEVRRTRLLTVARPRRDPAVRYEHDPPVSSSTSTPRSWPLLCGLHACAPRSLGAPRRAVAGLYTLSSTTTRNWPSGLAPERGQLRLLYLSHLSRAQRRASYTRRTCPGTHREQRR